MASVFHMHDAGDPVAAAANAIEAALRDALAQRGKASLMVSGGSSPKPVYETLSKADLDWKNVSISLVDERWVNPGEAGSNEDFIRTALIKNKAASAQFIGLKTSAQTVQSGLSDVEARLNDFATPFDVCVMGMGTDGHTASWFPNASGLNEALSSENNNTLCYVNAVGCCVAGDHTDRISLTLSAVLAARHILLFIPGEQKRAVFDAAAEKPLFDAPVQALTHAGHKLHVFASPVT